MMKLDVKLEVDIVRLLLAVAVLLSLLK